MCISPPIILCKLIADFAFIMKEDSLRQPTSKQSMIYQTPAAQACEYPSIMMANCSIARIIISSNDGHPPWALKIKVNDVTGSEGEGNDASKKLSRFNT
jgi:hypothetical protein